MTPSMIEDCKASLLRNWNPFCDADPLDPPHLSHDRFIEQMEEAGLATWRAVTEDDLEEAFAYDRGIEPGGMIWVLTAAGRAAFVAGER